MKKWNLTNRFQMNGKVYLTDIETLEVLRGLVPAAKDGDTVGVVAVVELGLKTGRIVLKYEMVNKHGFEVENCSRCGGSGEYSFNLMYGTVCFRCKGQKTTFTKRGRAAHDLYERLLTIPAEKLEVGMHIWDSGGMFSKAGWCQVLAIEGNAVDTDRGGFIGNTQFRIRPTEEQRQAVLKEALDYQDRLTKTGKERK